MTIGGVSAEIRNGIMFDFYPGLPHIVKFGGSFKYTNPGVSVITVQLRHAKA